MSAAAADAIDAEDRSIDADVSALMRRLSNGMLPTPLYDYEKVMGGPHPLLTDAALAHMAFGGIGAHLPRRARAVADSVAGPCAVGKVPRRAAFELDMGWKCPLPVRSFVEWYGSYDHLTVVHLVLGNALVTAAREQLSAAHPLRRLLKPFTYRTVAVNRGARNLLCQVDLLSETLIDADEPPLDAGSARTPFAADHLAFRAVVHRFVQAYVCEYYSSDQVLLDDAQVRQMWAALRHRFRRLPRLTEGGQVLEGAWPLRRARARTPRETLVQVLTSLLVHVTAVHKHVGPAGEYVSDPRKVLSIALVTGFRQPMLMDDYTHVLLRDAHLAATRRIFDGFQAELAALSLEVRRKNARRLFRVQSFDPARLSSSVSI
ncbi:lipoxygenase [Pavlovales sp. CCMP2436]|nr:lipoxygenase [Pavlovales sp. CCMP2436]